jgi:CBS domain-containing protein
MTRVSDVMSPEVVACAEDTPMPAIADAMISQQIHAVFVVDAHRRPVGIVSDTDLLAGEWLGTDGARLHALKTMTARELMSAPVATIGPAGAIQAAVEKMRELHVGRLLVCNDSSIAVGVLSISDLVAAVERPGTGRACVRDVMSHAIVTCRPQAPLHAALRAMRERKSRSIVVTESDCVRGILTGYDVLGLHGGAAGARELGTVADLMTCPVITATPDMALGEAADLMLTREIHRLVVVDANGRGPLGLISTWDLVAEMADKASVWQRAIAAAD